MNKFEIKYLLETTMSAVDRLTDTNGKITLHNENLWNEIKEKDVKIGNLFSKLKDQNEEIYKLCLLYTSPSPRDRTRSRMPSSA